MKRTELFTAQRLIHYLPQYLLLTEALEDAVMAQFPEAKINGPALVRPGASALTEAVST
jgi:hypothetical protein